MVQTDICTEKMLSSRKIVVVHKSRKKSPLMRSEKPNCITLPISFSQVVHSHDMARVVQWMLKLGSASVRTSICEALCTNKALVTTLQSRYASFCVRRAMHYGSDTDRNILIQNCKGHFLKLLNHAVSILFVDQ